MKPSTVKVYQYMKKLDKNLEEAHFKSTSESFKIFQNILNNVLLKTTRTEITELEEFFDSVEKCTHSKKILSQANDNYGILCERMIPDLNSEIKFLR